jgi:hypothetical protein
MKQPRSFLLRALSRFWTLLALASFILESASSAAESKPAKLDEQQRSFLNEYCLKCHDAETQKGKLRLDNIPFALDSVELADRWQKILNQINSGEMPPEDARQPAGGAKTDFLEALSRTMVAARRSLADSSGKSVVRRLNRREYKNTLRELLGVDIDVRDLPLDGGAGTFDTVGASLFMSSDQIEQYLALGRRALDDAFCKDAAKEKHFKIHTELERVADVQLHNAVKVLTKRVEPYQNWTAAVDAASLAPENEGKALEIRMLEDVAKDPRRFYRHWSKMKGAPAPTDFGFKDAAEGESVKAQYEDETGNIAKYFALPHADTGSYLFVFILRPQESLNAPKDWPPGEYVLRVRIAALGETPAARHFIEVGHPTQPGAFDIISTHQVTGTIEHPQTIDIPVTLTSTGSRTFAIREKRLNSREHEVAIAVLYRNKHKTWYPPAMWIDWMELESSATRGSSLTDSNDLFMPKAPGCSDLDHARKIIRQFATRAFRGSPPEEALIESLSKVFSDRLALGDSFESALKESLSIVLAAPGFLYLNEPGKPDNRGESDKARSISNAELATRLSYFLWSAPPDTELRTAALEGALHKPETLAAQVNRMIASPKIREFVNGFVHQWLGLDRLDFFRFNARQFPEFDDSLKIAVRNEVLETFTHLLRSGESLNRLLKSDHIVINGLLANFYGIEGVRGDAFRPVRLTEGSPRGGLLGMSAVMAMGSNGERTSPVERGAWVLRKLLHDPPPPAPPNVPQLSRLGGQMLSPRERILAHQEEPQCLQCHRKIDPIGFGLENFNAIGQWRATERYPKANQGSRDWPIDSSGAFHNGPRFEDYFELRELIAANGHAFARGFTEALLEYALGRPLSFIDDDSVTAILSEAAQNDFALIDFMRAIACSRVFQTK